MLPDCLMRKRASYALFLIIFLLTACCPPCHQWKLAAIKADCPTATYVKVYLPACSTFDGMETELMCNNGNLHLYLNAFSLQFPANADDCSQTDVKVVICDQEHRFLAERLQGGQRLLLSDDAQQLIICSLLEGNEVEIFAGRYKSKLVCEAFSKTYDQLIAASFPK